MKLTRKAAIKYHRELWDWLYHHPSKEKWEWPEWDKLIKKYKPMKHTFHGIDGGFECNCFPCHYTKIECVNCLFDWGGYNCEDIKFNDGQGLFSKWDDARTPITRKKYAKLIRDVPERK